MIRLRKPLRIIAFGLLVLSGSSSLAQEPGDGAEVRFTVKAGRHARVGTPIRFEVESSRLGPSIRKGLEAGPVALGLAHRPPKSPPSVAVISRRSGLVAQAEKVEGTSKALVTCVLEAEIPSGEEATYAITGLRTDAARPWTLDEGKPGSLELKYGDRPVFRYNAAPVSSPNYGPIQVRDAYIHPAYSPSGVLITGDFSSSHPHHRGFFLAYERTKIGDVTPDFWNIHLGSGKIYSEGFEKPTAGSVTARFSTNHRWEAKDKATGQWTVVLRERWDVEAYSLPQANYWLFDITSTQKAVGRPFEILPYRYGGMAYRGPEPFVKGTLDVLTSDGKHRKDGDQKPARWVDLTGPIAEGSDQYAGAMIADYPANPHYPNVARIHPTTLPFFCYVPAYDKPLTIATDVPTILRYRVLIHDGHPDPALDDRVARDFAEPPVVTIE